MHRAPSQPRVESASRGFTLIELLVVIGIIGLLIGILVPVLGGVQNAAKKTATESLCRDVVNASTQFITDNHRAPGYYSAREMGAVPPMDGAGFSNSENVLLDLAGGIVATKDSSGNYQSTRPGVPAPTPSNAAPPSGNEVIEVAPNRTTAASNPNSVRVDNSLVGTGKAGGGYLQLKPDHLLVVDGEHGDDATSAERRGMVDIVDNFGQPLLIWTRDETVGANPVNFAVREVPAGANPPADQLGWYYWASNASYLESSALGERRIRQSSPDSGTTKGLSMLGADNTETVTIGAGTPVEKRVATLHAILGSPSFPKEASGGDSRYGPFVPAQARGQVVVVSAGADQVYFARKQKTAKADVVGYALTKDPNQQPSASNPADPSTNETPLFDDVVQAGGG